MKLNKSVFYLLLISILLILFPTAGFAEETPPPPDNCNYDLKKYVIIDPSEIMPNIDEIAAVSFNFQCDHSAKVEVLDGSGAVVYIIAGSQSFSSGDSSVQWDGKLGNGYAPDGTYTIKITPNDQFSDYPISISIQVYNFKYPALLQIYGEEFKRNLREYRKGVR